jgi:hypothetical protein
MHFAAGTSGSSRDPDSSLPGARAWNAPAAHPSPTAKDRPQAGTRDHPGQPSVPSVGSCVAGAMPLDPIPAPELIGPT